MINKIKQLSKKSIQELEYLLNDLENIRDDIDEYIENIENLIQEYKHMQTFNNIYDLKDYLLNDFNSYMIENNRDLDYIVYDNYYGLYNYTINLDLESPKDIKEGINKAID